MYTSAKLRHSLVAVFMLGNVSSLSAEPAQKTPAPDELIGCSDETLFNQAAMTAGEYTLDNIAEKIGCIMQKKVLSRDMHNERTLTLSDQAFTTIVRDLQSILNVYKNGDPILADVIPDLEIDGILGGKTLDLMYGLAHKTVDLDIFFDTYTTDPMSEKSVYMRHFRNLLIDTDARRYATELQLMMQDIAQNRPAVPRNEAPPEHDASCDVTKFGRTAKCREFDI